MLAQKRGSRSYRFRGTLAAGRAPARVRLLSGFGTRRWRVTRGLSIAFLQLHPQ